jgi:hypothetical protein
VLVMQICNRIGYIFWEISGIIAVINNSVIKDMAPCGLV